MELLIVVLKYLGMFLGGVMFSQLFLQAPPVSIFDESEEDASDDVEDPYGD